MSKFRLDDEHFAPEFYTAVDAIFAQCSSASSTKNGDTRPEMYSANVETWIRRIRGLPENIHLLLGPNQERLAKKILEDRAAAAAAAAAAGTASSSAANAY